MTVGEAIKTTVSTLGQNKNNRWVQTTFQEVKTSLGGSMGVKGGQDLGLGAEEVVGKHLEEPRVPEAHRGEGPRHWAPAAEGRGRVDPRSRLKKMGFDAWPMMLFYILVSFSNRDPKACMSAFS